MAGILYGIGVGPGDPELLTLKAVRLIKECDIIAVPGVDYKESIAYKIAVQAVPELKQKQILALEMPMTKNEDILKQNHARAARAITEMLDEGNSVGFLTLGDVAVYATYLYVHRLVKAAGYETKMISGIPSFCAAAAALDIGLSEQAQQLHIIPASYDIEAALQLPGTKVLMKSGKQIAKVKEQLLQKQIQAMMVENCGMENERLSLSTEQIDENAGYYSLLIVKDTEPKESK